MKKGKPFYTRFKNKCFFYLHSSKASEGHDDDHAEVPNTWCMSGTFFVTLLKLVCRESKMVAKNS